MQRKDNKKNKQTSENLFENRKCNETKNKKVKLTLNEWPNYLF